MIRPAITPRGFFDLTDTIPAKQDMVLRTIRSLVEDGLMAIGDLSGEGGRFRTWDVPLDTAMARVYDRFVTHYDDIGSWAVSVRLDLTEAGERVARELEGTAND